MGLRPVGAAVPKDRMNVGQLDVMVDGCCPVHHLSNREFHLNLSIAGSRQPRRNALSD
jgi:hypothetical protein